MDLCQILGEGLAQEKVAVEVVNEQEAQDGEEASALEGMSTEDEKEALVGAGVEVEIETGRGKAEEAQVLTGDIDVEAQAEEGGEVGVDLMTEGWGHLCLLLPLIQMLMALLTKSILQRH